MKKIAFGIILMILFTNMRAQDPVNEVFNEYAGKEGFTTVNITGDLFKMMLEMNKEEHPAKHLATQIDEVKILAQEKKSQPNLDFHQLIYNRLNKKDFKELMTVRDSKDNVDILAKEKDGIITEFLLIASGDENVLISIKGHIILHELADLSESVDLKGFEMLKKLETQKN